MKNPFKSTYPSSNIKLCAAIIATVWTGVLLAIFFMDSSIDRQNMLHGARINANTSYEKDIVYRRWNADHGGVYVPVTEKTKSNPYLDVLRRDVTTKNGESLTLINPAYMTRQVHEFGREAYGIRGHITSLNPIRPQNAPDLWETAALKSFQQGSREAYSEETLEGLPYLRFMRPLITEKRCLKCHAKQGYREGDIRGGISVSVPLEPYFAVHRKHVRFSMFLYVLIWITGIGGITYGTHRISTQMESRDKAETERKKAEEEKNRLETQLKRAEKMEAIGTLAGGVAHDLNNVLGGIVGYPDLLLHDIPEDSSMRSSLLAIKQSGQRASAIVQDLLTLARRGVQVTEVVNLNTILTKCLESVEYKKLEEFHPDADVETDFEKDLLNILGSPVHLSKTVINLLSNAIEAMPRGGKITISSENRYLDKPIKGYDSIKEGDYVVLSVKDNGTGIANEELGKIFEPFYTKKVMGRSGTGLGMAVVWGTVKDHQGYIDVKSTEGQGTTVTLYFPVTREEVEIVKEPVSTEEYSGNGEKILVVDDVEAQRDIATDLLKKLNYTVEAVASGEEALEYMRNNTADLLLLDMIMDPGIDGLDTYKGIIEMHPGQKAIIASGFSETDRVKKVQELGAGQYIRKPYALEIIGLAVKTELERRT
jgi:signal transduction histidine kinase/ActR/RegA family two-component response regulator